MAKRVSTGGRSRARSSASRRAAFAQSAATGNIEGVVTDASGGVLPGVTVVVKNIDTNVAREVTSDERRALPCDGAAAGHATK